MSILSNDFVTIFRKSNDIYLEQDISTSKVLSTPDQTPDEIREKVIKRLRMDPSVVLVLEGRDGICDETAQLSSGFKMNVRIEDSDTPSAHIIVLHNGDLAYEANLIAETEDDEADVEYRLKTKISYILTCIQEEDFSFVSDDCPGFEPVAYEGRIYMSEAKEILDNEGYQTEEIATMEKFIEAPQLFVHENDVVLLGSIHFSGKVLFVEMKRDFFYAGAKNVSRAIAQIEDLYPSISFIHWDDGTWSFRTLLDDCTNSEDFLEEVSGKISILREVIDKVENDDRVGHLFTCSMELQRQYFIYESIAESVKISQLKV